MLEEGLQGLADDVSLMDGEQMFQLLAEGSSMNFDARWKDLSHPLERAESRRSVHQIQKMIYLIFFHLLKCFVSVPFIL